jgi:RND family efflux transporter MFP subunit
VKGLFKIIFLFSRGIVVATALILLPAPVWAGEKLAPVAVVVAKKGVSNQTIPLTGSVSSARISQVSPKLSGYIEAIHVDEGDHVKKDDPVLHFDQKLAEFELARVRAQLGEARARLKEAKRQSNEAAKLVKKNHIAATAFEAAEADVEINGAIVERLRTELNRQQEILQRHIIYAPFDGAISRKFVEIGQWVDTNTALFELTEINPLRVEVPVPQYYFAQIREGTPVRIQFDALPDYSVLASVTVKVHKAQEAGRTFPIKIDITNDKLLIAPGMSARVHFQVGDANSEQVIQLPADTIIRKPDGSEVVWIINEQDGRSKVSPVLVKTGQLFKENLEIVSGDLKLGDRVVIKGNEILQPGQTVNITEQLDYAL